MDIIELLKESGEFHDEKTFHVHGNTADPKLIILFEKRHVFEKAIELVKYNSKLLLIACQGIPSDDCLDFIKKFNSINKLFFGDMDPISFYAYLTIKYQKRIITLQDKQKIENVAFAGVILMDRKYLENDHTIKLNDKELKVLEYIKQFPINELQDEIKFLEENKRKLEIEALMRSNYLPDQIKLIT